LKAEPTAFVTVDSRVDERAAKMDGYWEDSRAAMRDSTKAGSKALLKANWRAVKMAATTAVTTAPRTVVPMAG